MSAAHFGLDGLVALIDCNGIQADGPVVLEMEPVAEKWRAFGWHTQEVDGNDMAAVVAALAATRERGGRPGAIVLAEHAVDRIFLHCGVIAIDGRALLLPGRSFAGKTTLTAALVRAGAYSSLP